MKKNNKLPKILFVIPDETQIGGCEGYRMMFPARALEKLGVVSHVTSSNAVSKAMREGKDPIGPYDLFVFQRLIVKSPQDEAALRMAAGGLRAMGKTAVVDYDDDYSNEHRKVSEGVFPQFDPYGAVSVSTQHLAGVMKKYVAGKSKIIVSPNGIVPELMDTAQYKRTIPGLVIGLTGSVTHKTDWEPAVDALLTLLKTRDDVKVFVSGYVPERLKGVRGVITLRDLVPQADKDDFFVDLGSYGGIHANIDILLCPVDPKDGFNHSKSNLKAIEGQASRRMVGRGNGGSCIIATGGDLHIYKEAVVHGETGLLVQNHHDHSEWLHAINLAINNVELRNRLQVAGYQHCIRNYDINKLAEGRLATYQRLVHEAQKTSGEWLAALAEMEKT